MKPAKISYPLPRPESWQQLRWGTQLQSAITVQIKPWLSKLYGTHLLKIGALSASIDTSRCPITHQVRVSSLPAQADVVADVSKLPFMNKSVGACLLAHTLAWSQDPHQVLRGVDRVLFDDGWLILSEFNPLSLVGVSKLLPNLSGKVLYGARIFHPKRLVDWLSVLNYEIVDQRRILVSPWGQADSLMSRHFPSVGCVTLLLARKRTYPLNIEKRAAAIKRGRLQPAVNASRHYCQSKDQELGK